MKKLNLSYMKKVIFYYSLVGVVLVLLSLIGLAFNEWVLIPIVALSSVCGLLTMVMLVKGSEHVTSEGGKGSFSLFTILRFVLMAISIGLSALFVYLTMGEEADKMRYFLAIFSAVPFLFVSVVLASVKEDNNEPRND